MQASEWQLGYEVRGHGVWLHNRHFPPEAGIFVQAYQRGGQEVVQCPWGWDPVSQCVTCCILWARVENTTRGGMLYRMEGYL